MPVVRMQLISCTAQASSQEALLKDHVFLWQVIANSCMRGVQRNAVLRLRIADVLVCRSIGTTGLPLHETGRLRVGCKLCTISSQTHNALLAVYSIPFWRCFHMLETWYRRTSWT